MSFTFSSTSLVVQNKPNVAWQSKLVLGLADQCVPGPRVVLTVEFEQTKHCIRDVFAPCIIYGQ
ncbi:unnamed protein product [Clonostachys chloroleuca]|uniref:Uncharacterized protein n=1 Tax=Clonostachys chloroleuca TaxID=1926264 RepID=A0AA35LYR5_9HYPO|nr:unnamed protein product [Clonostachys chloroleuca]